MRTGLSLVADVLADAVKRTLLDQEYLVELLSPLAARNGFKKAHGQALLNKVLEIAGLDFATLADQLIRAPGLGESLRKALTAGESIEHYQKTAETIGLPKLVPEILSATGLQIAKPKSPNNPADVASQESKSGVNDVR